VTQYFSRRIDTNHTVVLRATESQGRQSSQAGLRGKKSYPHVHVTIERKAWLVCSVRSPRMIIERRFQTALQRYVSPTRQGQCYLHGQFEESMRPARSALSHETFYAGRGDSSTL